MPLYVKTQQFILSQVFTGPNIKDQKFQHAEEHCEPNVTQARANLGSPKESKQLFSTRKANEACSLKIKLLMILASAFN